MIFQISSRNNDKIKYLASLKLKKNRDKDNVFLLEGKKNIEMALKANIVKEIYTLKKLSLPSSISQYIISEPVLDKITSLSSSEGILALCNIPEIKLVKKDKLVYLDDVQDPGNVGTIIRTALAFNFDGVILSKNTADAYSSKVISASKGALFQIPVVRDDITNYKDNKIVVTTLGEDSIDVKDMKVSSPFILVMGNEGNGVSKEIIDIADVKVKIPMNDIDSLNVSVASGILMYLLTK